MMRVRKIVFLVLGCVWLHVAHLYADSHIPIQVGQLPTKAQTFISTYFKGHKVAMAKMENGLFYKSYDVIFTNGEKLEFNRSGEWREAKCKVHGVPEDIVPEAIRTYVGEHYPEVRIIEIEREEDKYEIKLSNHWEIKFDRQFRVIDVDY